MKNLKNPTTIALVATCLCVASLAWLMSTRSINTSLENNLKSERLKSEHVLSEKLQLEKEIEKMKAQLFGLKDKNLAMDNLVNKLTTQLQSQEAEYKRLKKDNLSLSQIRKQRQELLDLQTQLQDQLESLKTRYAAVESENTGLANMVTILEERNRQLRDDLHRTMFANVDQSQIQALKRKSDRLTIRARKTAKLVATFEVPSELKRLDFRVSDPAGNILTSKDGSITSVVTPSDNSLTASVDPAAPGTQQQKVEMVFTPRHKLATGLYTVEILNDNLYVGSLKVKLR